MNRAAVNFGVTLLVAGMATALAQAPPPHKPQPADSIMRAAYGKAKAGKKPVLVLFDATW